MPGHMIEIGELGLFSNSKAVFERLKMCFQDVTIVHQTGRIFSANEYESIEEGLFRYLLQLRSHGAAEFQDMGDEQYMFYNFFIRASGPKQL